MTGTPTPVTTFRSTSQGPAPCRGAAPVARGLALALVASLAFAGAPEAGNRAASAPSASRLRDVVRAHTLRGLDGRTFSVASARGEVVVVNFWASWCRPCQRELPELDALHAEIAKQGGRVIAVSIDSDAENARRFARSRGLRMPVYCDGTDGLARQLDLGQIPFTVVFDRDGQVAWSGGGADAQSLAQVRSVARRLLDSRAASNDDDVQGGMR